MIRILIALALALVLALCGLGWYVREAGRYQDMAEKAELALTQEKARTARIQSLVQKADKDAATARQNLKEALDAYPVWRDTPVPVPIYDSLCRTLRCVPARGVSAPAG
jgi:hypothetical protein